MEAVGKKLLESNDAVVMFSSLQQQNTAVNSVSMHAGNPTNFHDAWYGNNVSFVGVVELLTNNECCELKTVAQNVKNTVN